MRTPHIWIKKVEIKEGVRRVPISLVSMTGEVLGSEFESALERDLLLLTAFDGQVNWFQTQPITIDYSDAKGVKRHYTPDLLINFGTDDKPIHRPQLCEVKYREDLIADCGQLRPKFRAARAYCREVGWAFKIFDEHRIRTPRLANIQFLWRYKNSTDCGAYYDEIMAEMLEIRGPVPMLPLLERMYPSSRRRGEAIWAWWTMVVQGAIQCDLDRPITKATLFWIDEVRKMELRPNYVASRR